MVCNYLPLSFIPVSGTTLPNLTLAKICQCIFNQQITISYAQMCLKSRLQNVLVPSVSNDQDMISVHWPTKTRIVVVGSNPFKLQGPDRSPLALCRRKRPKHCQAYWLTCSSSSTRLTRVARSRATVEEDHRVDSRLAPSQWETSLQSKPSLIGWAQT